MLFLIFEFHPIVRCTFHGSKSGFDRLPSHQKQSKCFCDIKLLAKKLESHSNHTNVSLWKKYEFIVQNHFYINNAYSLMKVSILSDPNRIKNYCKVKTVALEEESKKCWGFGATLYQDLQRKVNQKPL